MKDKRLTAEQIDRILKNPTKLTLDIPEPKPAEPRNFTTFSGVLRDYDTLKADEQVKGFCEFIRSLISRYEENQRRQEEAEAMEMDIEHCIELATKLTEKEKKVLYNKLTDVLQTRRACKSENEILQPLYNYLNDRILLNKLAQLQGVVTSIKDIIANRQYGCRTNILDDFRTE